MPIRLLASICCALTIASCTRNPEDAARQYAARGDRFAQEGRHDAALIEYRNAVREWPTWRDAHQKLGDTLERLGHTDEAYRVYATESRIVDGKTLPNNEAELRAVVAHNPELAQARLALADELLLRDETTEAEEHLLAAAAVDPSDELTNRSLAALYLATGRTAEAERRLTSAAAQTPQRYRSQLALADFLMSERRYADARPVLERALDDSRLATAVKLRLAAIDYEQGRVDAAHRAVAALLDSDPTAEAWTLKADFYFRERDLGEALMASREALTLDPALTEAQELIEAIRRQQLRH